MTRAPLVLLAEDYDDARELYAMSLEHEGFRVVAAANGLEALQRAAEETPDIVVMDLWMPGLDGYGALAKLRARPDTAYVPVIALSAKVAEQITALARGFTRFCAKPCLPADLAGTIRAVLSDAQRA